MGFSGGGSNVLKAHTHDGTVAQDGGALNMDNITQAQLTTGDIVYSDGSHLQRLAVGTPSQTLAVNAGSTGPEWVSAGVVGSWVEIANQDDGSAFTVGSAGGSLFDDYKYIQVIYDFKQTGSDYVEFNWFDTVGTVTGNAQLYQWMEAAALNPPGGYNTSTNPSRVGYIENANTIFGEFLFQTQTTGSHQMVHFKTNCSGNNQIQQFQGVLWLGTSNRIQGMEYSGLGSITANTCSYKVLGLT
jgi:hypothetical protein